MNRTFSNLALALLACAVVAPAASISTAVTINATANANATFSAFTVAGTANFTGGIGNGKIASSITLASLTSTSTTAVADYTVTLTTGDTLIGKLSVPVSVLTGGDNSSVSVSLTVTNGTGTYLGATSGTTPITLTGSVTGSLSSGFNLTNFTGAGTITTGGTPPAPVPTVSAVQDAASNTPGIAQGSIFIVKGTNLSTAGYTPFAPPRPTASSGVKVTFTPVAGGTGTDAYLVYLYNQGGVNQIACILPSTVAVGNYNVTVTNGTASTPVVAQVVANKIALFTQDSTGTGLASAQNFISASVVDLNRLTTGSVGGVTISPAKPGQAVIAYGTGLGAYAAGDNTASPAFDFSKTLTIQAVVGGVTIPVAYAGRAGYAGEDQINFTLPGNVPTGCAVSLQISVNGKLSPPSSIVIAPDANSSACVMPGFTTQQLQKFDNGGTYTAGAFSITQISVVSSQGTQKINSIGGGFSQLTGFQLGSAAQLNASILQSGSCQVILATATGSSTVGSGGNVKELDAGTVTINGPAGSSLTNQALTETGNAYSYTSIEGFSIPGQASFTLVPGTYALSGAGGTDVGSFNTSLTLPSALTVTGGLPAAVTRSAGLTLNWTGGSASDLVEIIGSSSNTSGTGSSAVTNSSTFICLTTAGKGTFTVPASVLNQMYATTGTTTGILEVASGNNSATFPASLKAGGSIDSGTFGSFLGIASTPTYQ